MIRKANPDDEPSIMILIQNAVREMESKGIYQWDSIYPDSEVISTDINNGTLYVSEDGKNLKGIIVLNEYQDQEYNDLKWEFNTGKQLVVHRLCINPHYQGQGIARSLMEYAERHGKESGYASIRLDAFKLNKRACELYEKLGYKVAGTVNFRKGKFYCLEKKL